MGSDFAPEHDAMGRLADEFLDAVTGPADLGCRLCGDPLEAGAECGTCEDCRDALEDPADGMADESAE